MARNPEYQFFLDRVSGVERDPDPRDVEIPATDQEIGWWKQYQFKRAMRHARAGNATLLELIYLANHGKIYRDTPKEYIQKPRKK